MANYMTNYIVYGKSSNMKTYKAMDMHKIKPVNKLFYASIYDLNDQTLQNLKDNLKKLEKHINYKFEVRKTK